MSRQSNFKPRRQSQGMTPTGDHSGSERHIIYRRFLLKFSASNRHESCLDDVSFLYQHVCVIRILYYYIVLNQNVLYVFICFHGRFLVDVSFLLLQFLQHWQWHLPFPSCGAHRGNPGHWRWDKLPPKFERQAAMCAYVTRLFLIARIVVIQSIIYIYIHKSNEM